ATHRGSSQIAQSRGPGMRPRARPRPRTRFRPRTERTASTSVSLAATSASNPCWERYVSLVSRIAAMRTAERQNSATERDKWPIPLAHRVHVATLRSLALLRGGRPDAPPELVGYFGLASSGRRHRLSCPA